MARIAAQPRPPRPHESRGRVGRVRRPPILLARFTMLERDMLHGLPSLWCVSCPGPGFMIALLLFLQLRLFFCSGLAW